MDEKKVSKQIQQVQDDIEQIRLDLYAQMDSGNGSRTDYSKQIEEINSKISLLKTEIDSISSSDSNVQNQLNAINTSLSKLSEKVNALQTPDDPYYIGGTFSDYPAGTIIQTYDYDERLLELTSTTLVTAPTIYFTAEIASSGTIKISQKIYTSKSVPVIIKTYLNTQLINEHTYTSYDNTTSSIEFELFDVNFNTETKANNIYSTICYEGSDKTMTLCYQKIEITAPNALILNKNCPFNALYFNGKYYLSDCSSGKIKLASIDVSQIHNIDNLVWTLTDIPAQECYIGANYITNSDSSYTPNRVYYFRKGLDSKLYAGEIDDGLNFEIANYSFMDTFSTATNAVLFAGKKTTDYMSLTQTYYYPDNQNITGLFVRTSTNGSVTYSAAKINYDNESPSLLFVNGVNQNILGECSFGLLFRDNDLLLTTGTNATVVEYDILSNSYKFTANAYIKHYDKVIKYTIKSTARDKYEILSTETFGKYDKVFEMPNNDYFVVKNKSLKYYKLKTSE